MGLLPQAHGQSVSWLDGRCKHMLRHCLSLCRMTPSICLGEVCMTGSHLRGKTIACTCLMAPHSSLLLSPIFTPSLSNLHSFSLRSSLLLSPIFTPSLSDLHSSSSSTPQQWLQYAHTLCNGCHGNGDPLLPERTSFELFLSLLAAVLRRGGDMWRQLKGR